MRKSTKRTVAIALPIAVLGVAGVAYANSLTVVSDVLGGGTDTVDNTCTIATEYDTDNTTYVAGQGYQLSSVTVKPTSAACAGLDFRVTVTDAGKTALAEAVGTFGAALGTTEAPTAPAAVVQAFKDGADSGTDGDTVSVATVEHVFATVTNDDAS